MNFRGTLAFNDHTRLRGQHAYMSASSYHWLNYDEEKFISTYNKHQAVLEGTKKHELAAMLISMDQKLPKSQQTLNMYVNDAVSLRMTPEQVLYFSENCFGTADAISFKNGLLRIHDLKTGQTPAHMEQLLIYNALFCLEYGFNPGDIQSELRIYQNNEIIHHCPEADEIGPIMDKIITFDKLIKQIKG